MVQKNLSFQMELKAQVVLVVLWFVACICNREMLNF